jgi:hypothetical protein
VIALLFIVTGYGLLFPIGAATTLGVLSKRFGIRIRESVGPVLFSRATSLTLSLSCAALISIVCWVLSARVTTSWIQDVLVGLSATAVEGSSRLVGRLAVATALMLYALAAIVFWWSSPKTLVRQLKNRNASIDQESLTRVLRRTEGALGILSLAVTGAVWHEVLLGTFR